MAGRSFAILLALILASGCEATIPPIHQLTDTEIDLAEVYCHSIHKEVFWVYAPAPVTGVAVIVNAKCKRKI